VSRADLQKKVIYQFIESPRIKTYFYIF